MLHTGSACINALHTNSICPNSHLILIQYTSPHLTLIQHASQCLTTIQYASTRLTMTRYASTRFATTQYTHLTLTQYASTRFSMIQHASSRLTLMQYAFTTPLIYVACTTMPLTVAALPCPSLMPYADAIVTENPFYNANQLRLIAGARAQVIPSCGNAVRSISPDHPIRCESYTSEAMSSRSVCCSRIDHTSCCLVQMHFRDCPILHVLILQCC